METDGGAGHLKSTEVSLAQIASEPATMVRVSLDGPTVDHYAAILESLPPVDLYRLPDGRLVCAGGYHRLAAAQQRGWTTIPAVIYEGTLAEAVSFAAASNAKHGKPLTQEDRAKAILALTKWCPKMTQQEMAARLGCSQALIARIRNAQEVRVATMGGAAAAPQIISPNNRALGEDINVAPEPEAGGLGREHYAEIHRAPREHWAALVRAAQERAWSTDETREAVRNLRDSRLDEDRKQALLLGREDPVVVIDSGEEVYLPERQQKRAAEARQEQYEREEQAERAERERRLGLRFLQAEAKLVAARRDLREAAQILAGLELNDEMRALLAASLDKTRRMLDVMDQGNVGVFDADWGEKLRVIEGAL